MKSKICLLTDSLSSGGAEKVVANHSIAFSKCGYDVYIISMQDKITYNYDGILFNLGKVKSEKGKLQSLLEFKKYFRNHDFKFIVDHRVRDKFLKEVLFSKFIFNKKKVVYCVHSYDLKYYFSFVNIRVLALFPHVSKKQFVCVSNDIQENLKTKLNLCSKVIYNFLPENIDEQSEDNIGFADDFILGIGRLTKPKQFDKLIRAYKSSLLPENNIKLLILGDGVEMENLIELTYNLGLSEMVHFAGFVKETGNYIKKAIALVSSSRLEGFPMVLVEALQISTPVISFDCKSGPSEIIENSVNGILVENQNDEALINAMNSLLDKDVYNKLKINASFGLERFSENRIVNEWIQLLNSLR